MNLCTLREIQRRANAVDAAPEDERSEWVRRLPQLDQQQRTNLVQWIAFWQDERRRQRDSWHRFAEAMR